MRETARPALVAKTRPRATNPSTRAFANVPSPAALVNERVIASSDAAFWRNARARS